KSKILATIMMTPARTKCPKPSAQAAPTLTSTPTSVSVFGRGAGPPGPGGPGGPGGDDPWGCGAGARTFIGSCTDCRIMEGSGTERRRDIVTYAHPRTQGADRPAARAARGLS